jgi:uncharacterized membrane protein
MRELIVVGFKGTHRAAEVMDQILDLNTDWSIELHLEDAVAVYRTRDGRLRLDESIQPTRHVGAEWGGLLGVMIGGLLAVPFTGGASAAVAAATVGAGAVTGAATGALIGGEDAAEQRAKYGISENFINQVGGVVQPGQSALFLLAETDQPREIAERFRGYGGTILRTTLRPEQATELQQVIGADRPVAR